MKLTNKDLAKINEETKRQLTLCNAKALINQSINQSINQ
jgi:hypothetical protein